MSKKRNLFQKLIKKSNAFVVIQSVRHHGYIRMKDGYEVQKEPLYYVYFPEITVSAGIEEAYLMKTRNGVELADNNDFDDMKFTEREIKAIDERYWAFAVPVEEEAE